MSTTALDAEGGRPASSSAFLVGLLGVAVILSYVDRGLIAVSGPLLKDELGITATEFGLAVSGASSKLKPRGARGVISVSITRSTFLATISTSTVRPSIDRPQE